MAATRPGRIRVTERSSGLLLQLLSVHRQDALKLRRLFLDHEIPDLAQLYGEEVRDVDQLVKDLLSTRKEMGWRTWPT